MNKSVLPDIQYHIKCKQGDIGRYVIIAGDPGRIEAIASHFDSPRQIASNREFNVYSGYLLGKLVTACSTGIGGPSTAIAIEELHNCGADTFIRIGTCGGIDLDVKAGDIVIATGSIRYEHTSREYAPIEFPAVADYFVTSALVEEAKENEVKYHLGVVQCKDSFYGQHSPDSSPVSYELKQKWEAYKKLGVKASEMESSTLFVVSSARNIRSGALFTVLWNQERFNAYQDDSRYEDTSIAIDIAVNAIKKLIQSDN